MAIELECDRCKQAISVPDDWGGKRVRCKGCNRVLKVPDPFTDPIGSSFNVEALSSPVDGSQEELVTEFAPIPKVTRSQARKAKEDEGKFEVECPHCGKTIKTTDPYSEILCSNCWEPVPALQKPGDDRNKARTPGPSRALAFYDDIMGVFGYPLGATGSILSSMLVAGGAILLPIGIILMFMMGVALNPISEEADVSWVPLVLAGMFAFEGIYFAGMGYSAMLDSARNTVVESDKPPELTWNPATVGSGIVGYITLVIVYGLAILLINYLVSGGKIIVPTSLEEMRRLRSPVTIFALSALTFTVPMVIIGLAVRPGLEGLSPGRIIRSIAGTGVHYMFLFAVVCFVLGIYAGIIASVAGWAIDTLMIVLRKGVSEGFGELLGGLLAWTILVGLGFYFALMMGRLHGLFARAFRRKLAFD